MAEFGYPHTGIKKGKDDGIVPVTFMGFGIYSIKQLLDFGVGEGGDDLSGWSWDLYPVKGVTVYNTLGDEPGEENSQAAQVAVYGVS
jgi:hypothetical protein